MEITNCDGGGFVEALLTKLLFWGEQWSGMETVES